jgi:hypothetical protein
MCWWDQGSADNPPRVEAASRLLRHLLTMPSPLARSQRQRLVASLLGVQVLVAGLIATEGLRPAAAPAAENLVFVSGAFRRSIPVADLEHLATTGEARGLLGDVMAFARQKPAEVAKLLKAELSLPVVLTSRLLNTRIGEAILARVARIIYPLNASRVGILQAYPVNELEVNIPALLAVMQKASSISQLVSFFSDSPLDGLRGESDGARSGAGSDPVTQKPAP